MTTTDQHLSNSDASEATESIESEPNISIMPLAGEGAMLAISNTFKIPFEKVKIGFDVSMVTLSLVCCIIMIHSIGSVGIGTVAAAFLVGLELKVITKFFGHKRDRILGLTHEVDD